MQYALLIYGDEKVWEARTEQEEAANHAAHERFMAKLNARDGMRGGAELARSPEATTVRGHGDDTILSDGPYAETAEQLGGFYLIEADDLDEALAFARLLPEGIVEVRPVIPHP